MIIKKAYAVIVYRLIKQYLHEFLKQSFLFSWSSMALWGGISLFVTGKVLPIAGIAGKSFGLMQFCGIISSIAMQVSYREIFPYIMDFEDKKNIYSEISYPIPPHYLFIAKLLAQAISYFIVTISLIPLLKIILFDQIIFSSFALGKFFFALFLATLFFSSMVFFIVSWIKHIRFAGLAWNFFIFPLWFLGGFQFSWFQLYHCNKILAYIDLLNPIIYINESLKIAIMQSESFLSFYTHLTIISCFSILFFIVGYKKIAHRLDIT